MAIKRLKFNKELCIGCQLCLQACSAMHEDDFSHSKARLRVISYYDKGKNLIYDGAVCNLCGICVKKCPQEAIKMNGMLSVDREACDGCGICAEVCPTKVIVIREEKASICDTCNGDPACVKICPHAALTFA